MRKLIFIISLFLISLTLKATEGIEEINYCTWMGIAANTIARNRDIGIDQNNLVGSYLEQGNNYDEQIVIITLIDRVYVLQKQMDVDTVTLETESACLGAFLNN